MRIKVRTKNELTGDGAGYLIQIYPHPDDASRDEELILYDDEILQRPVAKTTLRKSK